jgi:hypothetical protein
MHLLSRSTYMRGKQCPKALWLYKHRPELRPPVSVGTQVTRPKTGSKPAQSLP